MNRRNAQFMERRRLLVGLAASAVSLRTGVRGGGTVFAAEDTDRARTGLGVDGSRFTVNGEARFLLGFSYYAGLGAEEDAVRQDLDDFSRRGFNWLRLWATWGPFGKSVSAVDGEGRERQPYFDRLVRIVKECDDRGLMVDVTLARHAAERVEDAQGLLPNAAAHRKAVETLTAALKPFRNWYLDLANERDVGDARFVAPEELRELRALVREGDPERLVTASFGGHDLGEEDLRDALETIGVDFLCPHRPRHAESPGETEAATKRMLELMRAMGRVVPVHYQEPFRRGYTGWEPSADDFLADLQGARAGGAAGWCFHNGSERGAAEQQPRRSFDMETRRLMDQLDAEELRFIDAVRT